LRKKEAGEKNVKKKKKFAKKKKRNATFCW